MTIISHILAGILISKMFSFPYWIGIMFSIFPDIDHVFLLQKLIRSDDRFSANSMSCLRSPLHELTGAIAITIIVVVMTLLNFYKNEAYFFLLCYLVHIFLDFLAGRSYPYKYLPHKFRNKSVCYLKSYGEKLILEISFISILILLIALV